jgi:hypothetical protein
MGSLMIYSYAIFIFKYERNSEFVIYRQGVAKWTINIVA